MSAPGDIFGIAKQTGSQHDISALNSSFYQYQTRNFINQRAQLFLWVASPRQYPLHYHASAHSAGTGPGPPYGAHNILRDRTAPCSTDVETGLRTQVPYHYLAQGLMCKAEPTDASGKVWSTAPSTKRLSMSERHESRAVV